MKKVILSMILLIFFLNGCSVQSVKQDNPTGKVYREMFVLGNKQIPLPLGDWKVAGTGTGYMGKYDEVFLVKTTNQNRFAGVIIIISDSTTNDYTGYFQDAQGERKDHHYVSVKSNSRSEAQDLWFVSHYIHSFAPGQREVSIEYQQYFLDNKIEMPKLAIRSYHKFTGKMLKNRYLLVVYYYNPEIEGFDAKGEENWGTSSWHVARIASDPKKVSYVESIKKEGEILHDKLRQLFQY